MSDATLTTSKEISTPSRLSLWQKYEFVLFSVVGFVAKSYLLVRMPYREWYVNTTYTTLVLTHLARSGRDSGSGRTAGNHLVRLTHERIDNAQRCSRRHPAARWRPISGVNLA